MKNRTGLIISLFILFVIPFAGYLVLKQGAKDRMKISAQLQPKDSIGYDFRIVRNIDRKIDTIRYVDLPYQLKILVKDTSELVLDRFREILFIINDREDMAFTVYGDAPQLYDGERIYHITLVNYRKEVLNMGDILLLDGDNRVIESYNFGEKRLFGTLLEDISYLLPMLDYKKEKMMENNE